MQQKIHIIGGPTASGKSRLALEIAQKRPSVIINADAMQVYHELPVLTAQPTAAEREQQEHSLYGIFSASEPCSAGIWMTLAEQKIRECWEEGKYPIVVGGTGLYLKALMEGFSPIPEIKEGVRDRVLGIWEEKGAEGFHALLMEKDPATTQKLKPNDKQRHIRALEVFESSGKPLSEWQALPRAAAFPAEAFVIDILTPEREELYGRCDERFIRMWEEGALEEVRAAQIPEGASLTHALGFYEISEYIKGHMTREEAVSSAQQATRNYAKRQLTWFRHQLQDPGSI